MFMYKLNKLVMTPEVVKVNHACPALGKWIISFQGVHNMA